METGISKSIQIPEDYNYIAAFLTFACNLKCRYCINHFEQGIIKRKNISGKDWVRGLNRIIAREDLPVTLQGGEPSLHPDFIYIINNIKPDLHIEILTNLQFDIDEFKSKVSPERLRRDAPYASIRVSYHPGQMDLDETIHKTSRLLRANFSIGIWGVVRPGYEKIMSEARSKARRAGIDFRLKEFLGEHKNNLYGTYKYNGACDKKFRKKARCKTTEFLIDSEGSVFRCHADIYGRLNPIGHILSRDFQIENKFRECSNFGHCNPCDVKVKTNRYQQYGHTSVEVESIE